MATLTIGQIVILLAGTLLGGGGLGYYIQSRIRVREAKEMAGIQTEVTVTTAPIAVLQQQLAAKDAQLNQSQQMSHDFVESQMKRNDATTAAVLALAEQVRVQTTNLKDIGTSLQNHREESSARAGKTYEKISDVNERLAGLEAGIKNCLDTAESAAYKAKEAAELVAKVAKAA